MGEGFYAAIVTCEICGNYVNADDLGEHKRRFH